MSIKPEEKAGTTGGDGVLEAGPVPPPALNPFDPARAWVFGLLAGIPLTAVPGSISQYLSTAPMLIVSYLVVRRRRLSVAEVYRLKRPRIADLRLPVALALSLGCAEILLYEGIDYLTGGGFSRVAELLSGELSPGPIAVEILFAVVFAPLVEELFFRGFFASSMAGMGRGWTVLLPSLFFALAHNPVKWLQAFVSAVVWSVVVLETGSIAVGVAGHAANNLLGVLLTLAYDIVPAAAADVAYLAFLVAGVALGLLHLRGIKALWARIREYFVDLRVKREGPGGLRFLLSKWPYRVVLVMFVVEFCLYAYILAKGRPVALPPGSPDAVSSVI